MRFLVLLSAFAWISSFFFTSYVLYYGILSLFALRRKPAYPTSGPKHRFAAVIAARNEQAVIGSLVESLLAQDYPQELFDVIVVPNNCTDQTEQVAREAGATIFHCTSPVRSKGDALTQVFEHLLKDGRHDAFCVFDADNLVTPQFLEHMNRALCAGAHLAQGYRDSKNPHDTAVSGWYSFYYWMVNRFYNHARHACGLSAMINGSGFMVSRELLLKSGGWHTYTMTEDIEFTTQSILRGEKTWWVPEAITYDEQPLTFAQSWRQRKRWSTGLLQGLTHYAPALFQRAVKQHDPICVDQLLFFLAPAMQMIWLLSIVCGALLNVCYVHYQLFPQTEIYYRLFLSLNSSWLISMIMCLLVLACEKKPVHSLWKALLTYWMFIASWVPINLLCTFKKCTSWEPIAHTRNIRLSDLSAGK